MFLWELCRAKNVFAYIKPRKRKLESPEDESYRGETSLTVRNFIVESW